MQPGGLRKRGKRRYGLKNASGMKSKAKNEYENFTMNSKSFDQSNKNHKIYSRPLEEHIDKSSRDTTSFKAGVVPESSVSKKKTEAFWKRPAQAV